MELIERIKKEGGYQDVILGNVMIKGWRSCEDRWKLIESYIGSDNVVLDFGSHYGFFATKIANQGNIVISVEGAQERAEIQAEVLKVNDTKNVFLCHKQMSPLNWLELARTTETIDVILALSVLHYYTYDELINVLWLLSRLAPKVIIEYPRITEETTAAYDNVKKVGDIQEKLGWFFEKVTLIGEAEASSNTALTRPIFVCENSTVFRAGVKGYLSNKQCGRNHYIGFARGQWWVDNIQHLKKGFNLYNLFELNCLYPNKCELLNSASNKYFELLKTDTAITDMALWNVLETKQGLEIIDSKENIGVNIIYDVPWEQYQNRLLELAVDEIKLNLCQRAKLDLTEICPEKNLDSLPESTMVG